MYQKLSSCIHSAQEIQSQQIKPHNTPLYCWLHAIAKQWPGQSPTQAIVASSTASDAFNCDDTSSMAELSCAILSARSCRHQALHIARELPHVAQGS